MRKKKTSQFEILSETNNGILVGGFSEIAVSSFVRNNCTSTNSKCTGGANNCNGANCWTGCFGH